MTAKTSKRILKIKIKRMIDDSPDTSWLGEFSDDPKDYAIVATGEHAGTFVDDLPCAECDELEAAHSDDPPVPAEGSTCECSDPACPHCSGKCQDKATMILWRIDMEDQTGTDLCQDCGEDCMSAGTFTPDDPNACSGYDPVDVPRGREYRYFNPGSVDTFKPDNEKTQDQNKAARAEHDQDMRTNAQSDYDRMRDLNNGGFCFLGIQAEAEYTLRQDGNSCSVVQRLHSGGLWGVESDSDAEYFATIEREELASLRDELQAVGFSKRAISAALRDLEHVDA